MTRLLAAILLLTCASVSAQDDLIGMLSSKGYGKNTYAIIVANEDYQSYSPVYTDNEELAILKAEKFMQILTRKLGVPLENIQFYPDALTTHIKLAITKLERSLPSGSKVIFYYRGKLYSDKEKSDTWLVPVDVSNEETFYMMSLKDLCTRLNALNKSGITILLDAQPNRESGSSTIPETGFMAEELPVSGAVNMELYSLRLPQPLPAAAEKPAAGKSIIKILLPVSKSTDTDEKTVTVKGRVTSECPVEVMAVNGEEAHLSVNGEFTAKVVLDEGENIIMLEARNCAGWTRDYVVFNYQPPQPEAADQEIPAGPLRESGRNYAVVIGISKYHDPLMPDLFYPIFDARKVTDVLTGYYTFEKNNVLLLENPTKNRIIRSLDSLEVLITPSDNMLIFYAGHGNWDEKNSIGYWLPSDAAARVLDNWLMNSIITKFVSESKARHTLVIADACFGGSIFRTRALKTEEEKSVAEMYMKTSRKAMTSGDLTEVPDESVFVKTFVQKLTDNRESYLTTENLFFSIKPSIVNQADLIPQFGTIKNSGDQGGDFIFFRKQ